MPRFAPHIALPRVAFVPGRAGSVRPADDGTQIAAHTLPPDAWRANEAWLFGADLWNHTFLWEAHETWEPIWRAPFDTQQAEFVRGMIQCAAAGLKRAIGSSRSAANLALAGLTRIESVTSSTTDRYMGLEVRTFAAAFRAFIALDERAHESHPLMRLE